MDDSALCCCEYINEDGERSHILAAFCNCEAVDEAFDRLITLNPVDERTTKKFWRTLSDRLRIPWRGGARQVPLDIFGAVILVPCIILLACISWTMAFISYIIIFPLVTFSIHRFFRKKTTLQSDSVLYGSTICNERMHVKKHTRTKFFLVWLMVSVFSLIVIYFTQVIPYLKISPYENLLLVICMWISCTSMYLVHVTSCAGFEPRSTADEQLYGEIIESGAWRICGECKKQVPRQASHCRTCDACFLMRDHHCIWLDTCVSCVNDRWFVTGLWFGVMSLMYGSHLSLTSVCHPKLYDLYFTMVMLPHQCPDAFVNFQSRLVISGSCYGVLLGTLVAVALIQQLVCVVSGVRLREYRHRRQLPGQSCIWSLKYAFRNCLHFWWR
ncbi:palmitoyltransferase ZDHHC23-B-like isoform X2 [Macrobrachium nipponense]|uniref:palmitoyltransferase ZDHHC23-B-like isoform X2 n=1 Tax=Macrobrachium nipponense TaxID=159736 RepID=UPI0030C80D09